MQLCDFFPISFSIAQTSLATDKCLWKHGAYACYKEEAKATNKNSAVRPGSDTPQAVTRRSSTCQKKLVVVAQNLLFKLLENFKRGSPPHLQKAAPSVKRSIMKTARGITLWRISLSPPHALSVECACRLDTQTGPHVLSQCSLAKVICVGVTHNKWVYVVPVRRRAVNFVMRIKQGFGRAMVGVCACRCVCGMTESVRCCVPCRAEECMENTPVSRWPYFLSLLGAHVTTPPSNGQDKYRSNSGWDK